MERKVIKQGPATLMLSIPAKWVKRRNIKAGDLLSVSFEDNKMVVATERADPVAKEATIQIKTPSRHVFSRQLMSLYVSGYKRVMVKYKSLEQQDSYDKANTLSSQEGNLTLHKIISRSVDRLIGAEIISQSDNVTEIELLSMEKEFDLEKIERRIFSIIKNTLEQLHHAIRRENPAVFCDQIEIYHDHLHRYIHYLARSLDLVDLSFAEKQACLSFYMEIDQVIDRLRDMGLIIKDGITKVDGANIKLVMDHFLSYWDILDDPEQMDKILVVHREIKRGLYSKRNGGQKLLIGFLFFFIHTINSFSYYGFTKKVCGKKNRNAI
jgi:phosphate uptake regulator